MDKESRQSALDNISAEDLEKIRVYQAKAVGAYPVSDEWLLLAEFGIAYGWEAYCAARDDKIQTGEMMTLIQAKRKLEQLGMFKDSMTSFVGMVSAQSRKPSNTLKSLVKNFINKSKADE